MARSYCFLFKDVPESAVAVPEPECNSRFSADCEAASGTVADFAACPMKGQRLVQPVSINMASEQLGLDTTADHMQQLKAAIHSFAFLSQFPAAAWLRKLGRRVGWLAIP